MLFFFKRSPSGLKENRQALAELAKAIRILDRQRDTHGILTQLRGPLRDLHKELNSYETRVSRGEDNRESAEGFRTYLSLFSMEIRGLNHHLRTQYFLASFGDIKSW